MSGPLVTVTVQTHNRPAMLRHALASLAWQTCRDFDVVVIDNGSTPPAGLVLDEARAGLPGDPRLVRIHPAENPCDAAERLLDDIRGMYHLLLADDDVLLPRTLERVAAALRGRPGLGFLTGSHAWYDLPTGRHLVRADSRPAEWTGELTLHRGKDLALGRFAELGYGPRWPLPAFPDYRYSTTFLAADLIRKVKALQGTFALRPHGEAMYVASAYHVEEIGYLRVPLACIAEHASQEIHRVTSARREAAEREGLTYRHTPLRGKTWCNIYFDHYLYVHRANGMAADYPLRPRPKFFLQHMRESLQARPRGWASVRGAAEAVPGLVRSVLSPGGLDDLRRTLGRRSRRSNPPPPEAGDTYPDILAMAEAVDATLPPVPA